jgi:hypothetical protein
VISAERRCSLLVDTIARCRSDLYVTIALEFLRLTDGYNSLPFYQIGGIGGLSRVDF